MRALVLLVLLCATARAQGVDMKDDSALAAKNFDPSMCEQFEEDTLNTPAPATEENLAPVTWTDFDLSGKFLDKQATVRALFEPTMQRHRALTADSREDIRRSANAFGYHVVGIGTREAKDGTHVVVHVEPLPIVRLVDVDPGIPWYGAVFGGIRLLHDDVRRRMRTRTGAYMSWDPIQRRCEIEKEKERIIEFLHDEGYFDAQVQIAQRVSGIGVTLKVKLDLGSVYQVDLDRITVPDIAALAAYLEEIREHFVHKGTCLVGRGKKARLCYGDAPFRRSEHQADLQSVAQMFKDRGYPSVRVTSDFSPERSIDRRTKTVRFTVTIDQRRRLEVWFEGYDEDSVKQADLRKQLTFNEASSADDVEAEASARAIAAYLQSKGYFDARVTWIKERFGPLDKLVFRIEQGASRAVQSVEILGNRAISEDDLREVLGTKTARLSRSLFGGSTAATSDVLAGDVGRIVNLYRRNGYRDARVRVTASTDPTALESAALTAALVSANRGQGLYVRFTIDEGLPTLVTQVHVEVGDSDAITPDTRVLCEQILKDLAELYKHPGLAKPASDRCIGIATDLAFREDDAAETDDRLKDRMFSRGRPRAEVSYEPVVLGPRRIVAKYKVSNVQQLKVGKVVIRGNFRTRASLIKTELGLKEGSVLTSDKLAEGARRLRNTALFDSVNIAMPDLDNTSGGTVNAVVEVTERYDYRMGVSVEGGYSSFNGAFLKLSPSLANMFGTGIALDLSGTIGANLAPLFEGSLDPRQLAAEATLRFPQFIPRQIGIPIPFQTELSAFHRRQETERFGLLRTTGATIAFTRTIDRPRREGRPARAITFGLHYDYRVRDRNVDALRPIGADDDDAQVPVTTITGSTGITFEWEQRVDQRGTLSPLAPEDGFRLDGQLSYAHPYLLSQDTFLKLQLGASRFWPFGNNVVLRTDLRYDQGFPDFPFFSGPALLPEVERFFAGGDGTVRGYADDRLATELIQIGVPPLSNISQIRVLPAGGNIRVLGSIDLQYRVWSVFATGLFFDAGLIKNQWPSVTIDDVRPAVGMTLFRIVTPFGSFAFERGVPLRPRLGDDPRGRWHINFAARAQF
ncbi:MAG: BamA/TamA family outer membrane protein [Myxococcota bacterium]|nr:BamA/TamA family outer membrane protein [Myxococcota bacterium]